MPVSSVTEHWIKPDAITINLNHFGDPDYLQVSVLAGAVVMAFKQDVISYNAAHNYRTWPLQAANTYLETTSSYNVYARLTRSEVNASALVVYDPILRDIEGRSISYTEDGNEILGEASTEFFYVFLGQISGSIGNSGQSINREWGVDFRFGQLNTSEQSNDVNSLFLKLFKPHFDDPTDPLKLTWIEAKSHIGVNGGVTMFVEDGSFNLPSIYDGLPIDGQTLIWDETGGGKVLKINPNIELGGGLDEAELYNYLTNNNYAQKSDITTALSGYATTSSLNAVSTKLVDFLEGSDTDTIINKWKELETFLSGLSESDNLSTILAGKVSKSYVDETFVTIAGTEDVTGLHNFVNGLKVGGLPITKTQDDVIYIDANLVVRGGITMYAENEVDVPNIFDGLPIDGQTLIWKDDVLMVNPDINLGGGASTLGGLLNVDDSIDASASVDRVLFQAAGSSQWVTKPLSEIGGSSSGGGSVSGDYLPLSGGTLVGNLTVSNSSAAISINNNSGSNPGLNFQRNGTTLGCLRLNDTNDLEWLNTHLYQWDKVLTASNYSS